MMTNLSLRVKLTLGYVLVFALTVLLGGLGVYFAADQVLMRSMDASLHETASIAQGSIENDQGHRYFAPELKPASDLSIALMGANGALLAQVGAALDSNTNLSVGDGLLTHRANRILTKPLGDGTFLRISKSMQTQQGFLETLARLLWLTGTLMIAAACGAGFGLADRALKPVDAVARTAQSIAERGDYAQRVPQAPGHDEMARLTRTVNAMLDQLARTIEHEKQFARIAAHELRTPLTALQGRLELTLNRPRSAEDYHLALTGMQDRVMALTQLSESLLALARTDAPVQWEPVELAAASLQAAEHLEEFAAQQGKRLHLDLEETWVQAEREGTIRAISNLLENALKYGEGSRVSLKVGAARVCVTNCGAGPAPNGWDRLLKPFERGAEASAVSGSGLGLALVASLAKRWNAALIPQWDAEGFQVCLSFPNDPGQNRANPARSSRG